MEVVEPGHIYKLNNLKCNRQIHFQFHKDPDIHNGQFLDGPSCQEVLRMVIDRTKYLDSEQEWEGNQKILMHLRSAIALFESRALLKKIEKDQLAIEDVDLGFDGHLTLGKQASG